MSRRKSRILSHKISLKIWDKTMTTKKIIQACEGFGDEWTLSDEIVKKLIIMVVCLYADDDQRPICEEKE